MSSVGPVARLWRYPVSSFAGEAMDEIDVGRTGVAGDRRFGVVDSDGEPGRPDGNARWHGLPLMRASLASGSLEVAVPGRRLLGGPGAAADSAISDFLGFPARLLPFDRDVAPGFSGGITSSRYDVAPIHLLTTASLAELKRLHPAGDPDARRFRPNILVDMPAVAGVFPETEWIGRRLAVGDVELTIVEPCRRCGFTIIAQDGFENDPEILRQLVRNNRHNIGVYCSVDRPGRVAAGDPVRLI